MQAAYMVIQNQNSCNRISSYMVVSTNGCTTKWMVCKGHPIKMDDLGVPPFTETPISLECHTFFCASPSQPQKYTVPTATAMGSGSHPQQWNLPVPVGRIWWVVQGRCPAFDGALLGGFLKWEILPKPSIGVPMGTIGYPHLWKPQDLSILELTNTTSPRTFWPSGYH